MKTIILLLSLLPIIFIPPSKGTSIMNCRAKHTLIHNSTHITAFYQFTFNDSKGAIMINGKFKDNEKEYIISRNIYFNYSKIGKDNFLLTNKKIAKIPAENVPIVAMQQHYPLFFTMEQKTLLINLTPGPSGSYFITFVRTPLFLCIPQ